MKLDNLGYLPNVKSNSKGRGGSFIKTILWKLACFVLQACTVRDFPLDLSIDGE